MIDVVVLLSIGRHPVSGRARRAPADARALELALRLPSTRIHALHAGNPDTPALRDYLGQGLDRLTVLEVAEEQDPVPALREAAKQLRPALVIAGMRAEGNEDSGLLPYLVANALDHTTIPGIVSLHLEHGIATAVQALPRGRRRIVEADLPLTVTVSASTQAPRPIAYAKARRGSIERVSSTQTLDLSLKEAEFRPWRQRPKPSSIRTAGSALERMKAITGSGTSGGRALVGLDAGTAARVILDRLIALGMISDREGVGRRDNNVAPTHLAAEEAPIDAPDGGG